MVLAAIRLIHDRWVDLHPAIRVLLLAGAAAAAGLGGVKPCYRVFKQWRLEQNLVAARQAVTEVRMADARDLALTVLRGGDSRIEAFRILEQAMGSLRDPRHGDVARALIAHPEGSDEDRLTGFSHVAEDAPLGLVGQAWTAMPAHCLRDARFALVFADRLIGEGHGNEAAGVLLAVPADEHDGRLQRALIRVLLGSGKPAGVNEAQRLIATGFQASAAETSQWFDLLEEIPTASLQAALLDPVRGRMENAATADPVRAALILARLDYASQFRRRAGILAETIARWQDRDPLALARFLNNLGLHQLLLETFPAARVATHPELFGQVLEAAVQAGAWAVIGPLLDAHGHQIPKLEELAHRAVLAARAGDAATRAAAWRAVIAEAEGALAGNPYLTIYRITRAAGLRDESEQALVRAIHGGRGPLPLYADLKPLLQSLERQGNEKALLDICTVYRSFEGGNPVLLTQYAYLACLNQLVEPAALVKALDSLAKAYPKEWPIQCVLITVYLCAGQPDKAAAVVDGLRLDPAGLPPGYRAAYLTTQVLNRRLAKDDPQIGKFPWQLLLPSERRKFSELLRMAEGL